MARSGEVEIDWGDETHKFRLAIGQLRELQDKTGCGPMELFKRVTSGTWRIDDLRETIRIALIGGGSKPVDALTRVRRYFDDRPLVESVPLAQAILMVVLFGQAEAEEKRPGEPARRGSESGQMEGSPSPASTAQVQ